MDILLALSDDEMDNLRLAFLSEGKEGLTKEGFVRVMNDLAERKRAAGTLSKDAAWARDNAELEDMFDTVTNFGCSKLTWTAYSSFLISGVASHVDAEDSISPYFRVDMKWNERHQDRVKQAHYVPGWDKLITCNTRSGVHFNAIHSPSEDMEEVGILQLESAILAAAFIAKHHTLVCASGDMRLVSFDTIHPSWPRRRAFTCDRSVLILAYHGDFGALWMGDRDGCVAEMSDSAFRPLPGSVTTVALESQNPRRWRWHTGAVTGIQFIQRTCAEVITAGVDGRILVHDMEKGTLTVRIDAHMTHGVRDISWSPNFSVLVSVGVIDHHPHAWVLNYPKTPFRLIDDLSPHKSPIMAVHAIRGGPQVLTSDRAGNVKVWDLRQFRLVQTVAPERGERIGLDRFYSCTMCYVPATRQITIHGHRSFAWEYDARSSAHATHDQQVLGALYRHSTRAFATYSARQVTVWTIGTGIPTTSFRPSCRGVITCAVLGPAGRRIFLGTSRREVMVFMLQSGEMLRRYPDQTAEVTALEYSDPSRRLLLAADAGGVIRMLSDRTDATAGSIVREFRCIGEVTSLAWQPFSGGLCCFGTSKGEARCCELARISELPNRIEVGASEVNCVVSMSPLPSVAVADATGHLYIWAMKPYVGDVSSASAPVLCIRRLANPDYHGRKAADRQRNGPTWPSSKLVRRPVANALAWNGVDRVYAGDDGGWVVCYVLASVIATCRLAPVSPDASGQGNGVDNVLPHGVPTPLEGKMVGSSVKWRAHSDEVSQLSYLPELDCILSIGLTDPTVLFWTRDGEPLASLSQGRREEPGHPQNSKLDPYRIKLPAPKGADMGLSSITFAPDSLQMAPALATATEADVGTLAMSISVVSPALWMVVASLCTLTAACAERKERLLREASFSPEPSMVLSIGGGGTGASVTGGGRTSPRDTGLISAFATPWQNTMHSLPLTLTPSASPERVLRAAAQPVPSGVLRQFMPPADDHNEDDPQDRVPAGAETHRVLISHTACESRRSFTTRLPHGVMTHLPPGPLHQPFAQRPMTQPTLRMLPLPPEGARWRGGLLPNVAQTHRLPHEATDALAEVGVLSARQQVIPRGEASVRGAQREERERLRQLAEQAAQERGRRDRRPRLPTTPRPDCESLRSSPRVVSSPPASPPAPSP
eukprot:Hpha_TRINITY_DN8646_c0_g1::TRINITY_DN8646_c0_g1_i1::g.168683::m.168683